MCPVVVCGCPFLAAFRGPNYTQNLLQNHCTQRQCCPDTEQQNLGTIADALTLRPMLDLLFKVSPLPQDQCLVCAVGSIRGHLTNEVVVINVQVSQGLHLLVKLKQTQSLYHGSSYLCGICFSPDICFHAEHRHLCSQPADVSL
jgi:hypothetical protein